MEKALVARLLRISLGRCKLAPIALILVASLLVSDLVLATDDGPYNGSNLSLAHAAPSTADNGAHPLESKLERILSQVEVIGRNQEKLSKHIVDVCQQPARDPQWVKRTAGSGQPLEQVEKDVFKFNRLASNLIPSSTLQGQNYGRRSGAPSLEALIQQESSAAGALSKDNAASSAFEWASVKEQLASLRLALNKLMSRVLEQSYQYEKIWSQLALIKDECSLAYQSTLGGPNGLVRQVSDSGPGSWPISATDSTNRLQSSKHQEEEEAQRCQSGGLRSSDISTLVRLLSQELSNVCASKQAAGHHLHELGQPKVDALLARQLAEISSVTKQSAQILNRLAETLSEQRPTRTLVLEPVEAEAEAGGGSTSGAIVNSPTNATTSTAKPASGRTSSRWQPGSKVPQNCRSSTGLEVPRGCQELRAAGATCSGKYLVYVMSEWRQLYCDMHQREPWTVVMRRIDKSRWQDHGAPLELAPAGSPLAAGSATSNSLQFLARLRAQQESFNVDWLNYERGFGAMDEWAEFFGGLALMHKLTGAGAELQLELEWSQGRRQRLDCGHFAVANASLQYRASVANCSSRGVGEDWEALVRSVLSMDGAPFQVGGSSERPWGWWRRESGVGPEAGAQQPPEPTGPLPLVWPHDSTEPLHRLQLKVRPAPSES